MVQANGRTWFRSSAKLAAAVVMSTSSTWIGGSRGCGPVVGGPARSMGVKMHFLARDRSAPGYLSFLLREVEGKITLQRGAGQRHQLQEERLWTPPVHTAWQGDLRPVLYVPPVVSAPDSPCLARRSPWSSSVRRAAPSLAPHLMQSSRAGSAPLQEVPEPHQSSPSHRPYQPRLQGGRDNQIDAAGRECTSRSNFTAIMVVHVQRRLWPPLSGVGCDNSPTGVRDGGYDPPWVRRHAHPPQQAPGGSGRRRSRHRFIGHGKQPGGRRHGGPSGGCSRPTTRVTSEMTSRCPIRPRDTPTRQLGGARALKSLSACFAFFGSRNRS